MTTAMTTFVRPFYADQHLTNDGGRTTLCGFERIDVRADIPFHDHREGFVDDVPACERCADEGDRIQNGRRR